MLSESNPLAFVEVEAAKENKTGFVVFHFGAKEELRKSFPYSKTKDLTLFICLHLSDKNTNQFP